MAESTVWWLITGCVVAAELLTGTFYLLMLAIGLAAAALAAHAGLALAAQIGTAAVIGGGAVTAWHLLRPASATARASANRDVNLDIGEHVHVTEWAADRTARVQYRGSPWSARLAPGAAVASGEHVVTAVEGNWLVLAPTGTQRSS